MTNTNANSSITEEIVPINLGTALRSIERKMRVQFATGHRVGATPLLMGPPGVGKTATLSAMGRKFAKESGKRVLVKVVTLVDREVPDVRGQVLPVKDHHGVFAYAKTLRSDILPHPDVEDEYDHVFLIIDEVPAATMDHIKAINSLLLDYTLGDTKLDPAKYYVCATGNGTNHRSGSMRLPAHGINRVQLLHVRADVELSISWMRTKEAMLPPISPSFVATFPNHFAEPEVPAMANTPFCTIRSFTDGVRGLMVDYAKDPMNIDPSDPDVLSEAFRSENAAEATALLAGNIGRAMAHKFMNYARIRDQLVPLEEIMKNPEGARLPSDTDMSAAFAQANYVGAWCTDKKRAEALLAYTGRLRADVMHVAVMGMMAKYSESTGKSLSTVKGYGELMRSNVGLMHATLEAAAA